MKLSEIIESLPEATLHGDADVQVRAVREDSRLVEPGDVFVAVSRAADGHRFATQAVERGAVAVVAERALEFEIPVVVVPSSADALGLLAARVAGNPADKMELVGITGTNGKTTTAYVVESILRAAGAEPGVMGTVSYRYGGADHPAPYTTPTPLILHQTFRDMVAAGCSHTVMEVSSAALLMDRMAGVALKVAAFSNLTQDHLDVHQTMEHYGAAKARIFSDCLSDGGTAVINIDDPASGIMIAAAGSHRVLRVSANEASAEADVRVVSSESTIEGIRATIETPRGALEVHSSVLIGGYNIANIALAVGISEALGIDLEAIARGIADMPGVPGRVERVANEQGLDIVVDYAHTPDALTNVLGALRPLASRRLICVFGCGGDRDPDKRPKMGAAVAAGADLAVVTSDNPRTEEPQSIVDMIVPAVPDAFVVEVDRSVAIRAGISEATPGDIVLIAGKGHEDYQILGTEKVHFDDREVAAAAAAERVNWSLSLEEILEVTGGDAVQCGAERFSRVILDGRSAAPGDLYVAVRGESYDGHAFCAQAVQAGATGLLVDSVDELPAGACVIRVPDTRVAMGLIARIISRRWGLSAWREGDARIASEAEPPRRLVAVTGSAGKTTTKELIRAALASAGRVHASVGSLNNETGVPLTLLGLRPWHDYAVVEMGMRALGQIAYLVDLAEPHVGVVVNAGSAHVGEVGSVDAIARGKAEVFGALPSYGCAVYPADDARLAQHAASAPRQMTFSGTDEAAAADVQLVDVSVDHSRSRAVVQCDDQRLDLTVPLPGRHNAINACCALAVARCLGVDVTAAARGIETARPAPLRGEIRQVAGRHVLADCYNANPASMAAALDTLADLARDSAAVAVLGDMLELGDEAPDAHRAAGRQAAERGFAVIALGDHAAEVVAGAQGSAGSGEMADDPAAAAAMVLAATKAGDWVLLKASRGMRLERVIAALALTGTAAEDTA